MKSGESVSEGVSRGAGVLLARPLLLLLLLVLLRRQ
jgi:hypothetical protein